MSRILLASLLPLAVLVGCGDPTNSDGNGDNTCTDANCDDTDPTPGEFVATIIASTPFDGVKVTVDGADADCVGTSCTFTVTEADEYEVEAWDTYTFVPKEVQIDNPGEFQVSWSTGGCASDPDWNADTECNEWVPGEYGMPPLEGSYTDENWGLEVEIIVTMDDSIVIEDIFSGADATMSAESFHWAHEDAGTWIAGTVIDEETFTYRFLDTSGNVYDYLFHRD